MGYLDYNVYSPIMNPNLQTRAILSTILILPNVAAAALWAATFAYTDIALNDATMAWYIVIIGASFVTIPAGLVVAKREDKSLLDRVALAAIALATMINGCGLLFGIGSSMGT